MDKDTLKRHSFMALLTLALLAGVQAVSIVALYQGRMSAQEYLGLWTPLLTLSLGYWFGRNGGET